MSIEPIFTFNQLAPLAIAFTLINSVALTILYIVARIRKSPYRFGHNAWNLVRGFAVAWLLLDIYNLVRSTYPDHVTKMNSLILQVVSVLLIIASFYRKKR